jgi:hypothetical protein
MWRVEFVYGDFMGTNINENLAYMNMINFTGMRLKINGKCLLKIMCDWEKNLDTIQI